MGITEQGLEFLVSARSAGVSFARTMTIGRQSLLAGPDALRRMLQGPGRPFDLPADHDGFAEPVFERLGAGGVSSLDASAFEGASCIHDLNTPIPPSLVAAFTAVVDGGALEHIFDFPTAVANCMRMVEPGGHLLSISPANNAAGHGFYQFSPDLYFRLLSPENGFIVERMLLAEVHPRAVWYRVVDPAERRRRVEFTTTRQAYLYVQARRLRDGPLLERAPVQSDYQTEWRRWSGADAPADDPGPPSRWAGRLAPVKTALRRFRPLRVRGAAGTAPGSRRRATTPTSRSQ